MAISAKISSEIANLQAQVAAATPLANAPFATITAMQLNAEQLVTDIQSALTAPSTLDTWAAPTDPASIITGLDGVVTASEDQSNLSLMRGVTGRVSANLDRLV